LIRAGEIVAAASHPFGELGGTQRCENSSARSTKLTPRRCRQCNLGVAKPPGFGGTEWREFSNRQGRGDCFDVSIRLLFVPTRYSYRGDRMTENSASVLWKLERGSVLVGGDDPEIWKRTQDGDGVKIPV
jgi:hypothetical protein